MSWFGDKSLKPFFGTALDELLASEKRCSPPQTPNFVEESIKLLAESGLSEPDLFFRCNQQSEGYEDLKKKMHEYKGGRIPKKLAKYAVHDIAEVLKEWLRLLPEPLVPQQHIAGFIKVQAVGSSWSGMDEHSEKIKELRTAVQGLPDANRVSLSAFCVLLHSYSQHDSRGDPEKQQESIRRLTDCFDVLVFCSGGDKSLRANGMQAAMSALIEYSPYIFEGKDYVVRNASPEPQMPSTVHKLCVLRIV